MKFSELQAGDLIIHEDHKVTLLFLRFFGDQIEFIDNAQLIRTKIKGGVKPDTRIPQGSKVYREGKQIW